MNSVKNHRGGNGYINNFEKLMTNFRFCLLVRTVGQKGDKFRSIVNRYANRNKTKYLHFYLCVID